MEVNRARDEILAHAAFPSQQHRGPRGPHALNGGEDFLHGPAASDNIVELVAPPQLFFQFDGDQSARERRVHVAHYDNPVGPLFD